MSSKSYSPQSQSPSGTPQDLASTRYTPPQVGLGLVEPLQNTMTGPGADVAPQALKRAWISGSNGDRIGSIGDNLRGRFGCDGTEDQSTVCDLIDWIFGDDSQQQPSEPPGQQIGTALTPYGFDIKTKGGTTATVQPGGSLSAIAQSSYGSQDKYLQEVLVAAHGGKTSLQPNEKVTVPGVDFYETRSLFTGYTPGTNASTTLPVGGFTYNQEIIPDAPGATLKPHDPGNGSGLTIGAGYDMQSRSADSVYSDLIAAGLKQGDAEKYKQYKLGKLAASQLPSITEEMQAKLFVDEYKRKYETLAHNLSEWCLEGTPGPDGTHNLPDALKSLDKETFELLMDLQYRGDLTKEKWEKYLKGPVLKGDKAGLATNMKSWSDTVQGGTLDKGVKTRFKDRVDLINGTYKMKGGDAKTNNSAPNT